MGVPSAERREVHFFVNDITQCPARDPTAIAILRVNRTAGWGHPALRGNNIIPHGRGGACPARGFAAMTILRVIRRGGIYAARCSHPDITIYRVNRTGRNYASPTNLPKIPHHHGILKQQKYAIPIKTVPPGGRHTKSKL